jgi:cytochrome b
MTEPAELHPIRVWDLPTRCFHWLLAATVIGQLVTGTIAGNALVWHIRLGMLVLALLVFRLLWGVMGGHWSRFTSFVRWPGTVLRYLRGEHRAGDHFDVGHNPLGSFSVLAMLAVLIVQVATGLLADDEIATTGPLNRFVSTATGLQATAWHKGWGQWIIIGLVVLHLVAIGVYTVRGHNLVKPMLSGDKQLPADVPPAVDTPRTRLLALVLVVLCAGLSLGIARLGG